MTLIARLRAAFRRPDPIEPTDDWLLRLQAEARVNAEDAQRGEAISRAFDRAYRDRPTRFARRLRALGK
jgi:hypothetical protein